MPIDDLGMRDIAHQSAVAGGLGLLGRLIALAQAARRPSGWNLLWEVPLAIGMGVIGKGIADWWGMHDFPHYACVIAVAYTGPRLMDIALLRWAGPKG